MAGTYAKTRFALSSGEGAVRSAPASSEAGGHGARAPLPTDRRYDSNFGLDHLIRLQQFAGIRHGDGAIAEQVAGDGAFGAGMGQLERIGRGEAVIDHQAR
jgi:hypothetical protein